jgi:hypothetical protein
MEHLTPMEHTHINSPTLTVEHLTRMEHTPNNKGIHRSSLASILQQMLIPCILQLLLL